MTRSLHVRLDPAAAAALDVVRADGLNDSEAAGHRVLDERPVLREEAARLSADPADRAEMRAVRELMADLAPPHAE